MDFDLLAIGSGPAGQKAALQASKLGKRAAVVERMAVLGGVSINTGTIPSKTLREAVVYLTGYHQRGYYGTSYTLKTEITMSDLMERAQHVIESTIDFTRRSLVKNDITILSGEAWFVDQHSVAIRAEDGTVREVTAENILIGTGSEASREPHIPFDGRRVLTSDDLLKLTEIPNSLAIIGAGIIGSEYASMFAALGIPVTLIDRRPILLPFVDAEIGEHLMAHLGQHNVAMRLNDDVASVDNDHADHVDVHLTSGETVRAEAVLYSIGRVGATARLNLASAGLEADERGRIRVNEHFQTAVEHIYAAGDVIGHPALAATSMEQGRLAACHAFGLREDTAAVPLPNAIYTMPEIAMVGPTSSKLEEDRIPFVTGRAHYREVARGQILGDSTGFLKMLFHTETGRLLGIHALGAQASELVHIGQAVMAMGGGLDYFVDTVFNYPTLAECYKNAALDAANEMRIRGCYDSVAMFVPAPPIVGPAPSG